MKRFIFILWLTQSLISINPFNTIFGKTYDRNLPPHAVISKGVHFNQLTDKKRSASSLYNDVDFVNDICIPNIANGSGRVIIVKWQSSRDIVGTINFKRSVGKLIGYGGYIFMKKYFRSAIDKFCKDNRRIKNNISAGLAKNIFNKTVYTHFSPHFRLKSLHHTIKVERISNDSCDKRIYIKIDKTIKSRMCNNKIIKSSDLTGRIKPNDTFTDTESCLTISTNPDSVVFNYTNDGCAVRLKKMFLRITKKWNENEKEYYFIRRRNIKPIFSQTYFIGNSFFLIGIYKEDWDIDISPDGINWFHWIGEKCLINQKITVK